ncbi:MAG TPA: ATP-dependent Clp protease proteolytic subunit [Verrucomicrobiae bacterium]|nr:ATP-dependent Clp protease proteolytic subunit [Verrucomicrobiae bacterium]
MQSPLAQTPRFAFNAGIDEESVSQAINWLLNNQTQKHLTVLLTTQGGSAFQGLALRDAIRLVSQNTKVSVVTLGACMSAGILVLTAVPRENRFSGPLTRFLIHPPKTWNDKQNFAHSTSRPSDKVLKTQEAMFDHHLEEGYNIREILIRLLHEDSCLSLEEAEALYSKESYFSAAEALKMGIIGSVLSHAPIQSDTTGIKRPWWRFW